MEASLAAGALVVSGGDGAWRRADAGADLSGHLRTRPGETNHAAARGLTGQTVGSPFTVALAHTVEMTSVRHGAVIAAVTCVCHGPKFLSRTWFELDLAWDLSLIVVGLSALYLALHGH